MTYQNIMIDMIKEILTDYNCNYCPLIRECNGLQDNKTLCKEMEDWLNEQYI